MGWTPARAPTVAAIVAVALGAGVAMAAVDGAVAGSRPAAGHRTAIAGQQSPGATASIVDPGDVLVGTSVKLNATGPSSPASYAWDFGDGSPSVSGAAVEHTFRRVDDYTVRVAIQNQQGATDVATRTIRVVPAVDALSGQPELGQIVPASSFTAYLLMNAAGPARISVKVGGTYLSSDRWDFVGGNASTLLEIPDIRVVNEDDPDIMSGLISRPGASIPLINNVTLTLSYPVSNGDTESVGYTLSLMRPAPGRVPAAAVSYAQSSPTPTPPGTAQPAPTQPQTWSITYPTYLPIAGRPVNGDDVDDYYLKGDGDFHNVDTTTVRRWAIKIARNGGVFPNDPQRAADNIYRYVNGLLGIGDPGELQTDLTILGRVEDGVLVPGARKGEYICIAHAYFLSSLTRTLGLATRELTVGFGRGVSQNNDGSWVLNFYQEGADEVWYGGAWHHYDTWIGTRDRSDYLSNNLTEIAWYAYSTQHTQFLDVNGRPVGLEGHDFSLGKFVGTPGSPEQWRFLEQQTRPGVRIADPGPDAYASIERAVPAPRPAETVVAGIRNPETDAGQ